MRNMIFIGGIHGVGKTFFSNNISKEYSIGNYSASELISKKKQELFSKDKKVDNIGENQDFLKESLEELVLGDKWFLLDGHFCLLNKDSTISRISEETFYGLSPKAIVVISDSIENISLRLKNRDNIIYDEELLRIFLNDELNYSRIIASNLNIPYFVYDNSDDPKYVREFISNLLAGSRNVKS